MELNRDFSEFIASCVTHDVRFMIVGGYAVAAHGHPRFTKDLDVWVWSTSRTPTVWDRRVEIEIGGKRVPFISADDLLANKKASGRPQDLADVAAIEELSDADDQPPPR